MTPKLRVARPTDNMAEVIRFYHNGLGLKILGSFEDHNGFDGVMLGQKDAPYHLEFTHHRGHRVGKAPTQDNLLVFYIPQEAFTIANEAEKAFLEKRLVQLMN